MRRRILDYVLVAAVLALVAFLGYQGLRSPNLPRVEAQFAGQSAVQVSFSFNHPSVYTIIPPCIGTVPTPTKPCFPNANQIGHAVTLSWASASGTCLFYLEGSNDNAAWYTLAAASAPSATSNQMIFANGYFTFMRGETSSCNGNLTGVYTATSDPLPINPVTVSATSNTVAGAGQLFGDDLPYILTQIICFNPDSTHTAYVQLFDSSGSPTLGTGYFFQLGLPPLQTVSAPNIYVEGIHTLWAGASTTQGGGTAISGFSVGCSASVNATGPYYPLLPASP